MLMSAMLVWYRLRRPPSARRTGAFLRGLPGPMLAHLAWQAERSRSDDERAIRGLAKLASRLLELESVRLENRAGHSLLQLAAGYRALLCLIQLECEHRKHGGADASALSLQQFCDLSGGT